MSRGPILLLCLLAACSSSDPLPVWIHTPANPSKGLSLALADLQHDLAKLGATEIETTDETPLCAEDEIHVSFAPSPLPSPQQFRIEDSRCGDGHSFELSGGSDLSQQWAVYALLESLGIRYYHPEQTFYPSELSWPVNASTDQTPFFGRRDFQLHRTHPVELSAPLEPGDLDMGAFQRRWIDWNVKVRSTATNGFDEEFAGRYAYERGFPKISGFNLLNSQQGGRPVIDPDDPRSEEDQIADVIQGLMHPEDGVIPEHLTFQFNPSEFTEAPDTDTVRRLTFIAEWMKREYPDVPIFTINHGTHQEPTENYGVRFYDLIQFAPENLGAEVHTLMFYDLERPSPVYGNADFRHTQAWIRREAAKRPIVYYPEGSWWLTFDLPVPLYLAPVTIDARQKDIDLLRDLVTTSETGDRGVVGHKLFTSGQEWGYWFIDYCVARMTWDPSFDQTACWKDFSDRLVGGDEIRDIVQALAVKQAADLRDPDILRYMVGSDDETEIALAAGIDFHPLPPQPGVVLTSSEAAVLPLRNHSLPALERIARESTGWADRLDALVPRQAPNQAPWVREMADGVRVYALRAAHAYEVYATVLALRDGIAAQSLEQISRSFEGVERAQALTEEATKIVRRREQDYRYPKELTIVGDEPGTSGAIPNRTVYPYRYLGRTHRMFYWHRPDTQLAALFGEGLEKVRLNRRILKLDEPLEISTQVGPLSQLSVDYGDGTQSSTLAPHRYGAQRRYPVTLDATHASGILHHEDEVAIVGARYEFRKGSLEVESPAGAEAIEGLLPGLGVGLMDGPNPKWIMGSIEAGNVEARGSLRERPREGLRSPAADLEFPLINVGSIHIEAAELSILEADRPTLEIKGRLRTQEIIDLLVSVGGFEPEGARTLIARILEYTPDSLPEAVPFLIRAKGTKG